MDAFIDFVGTIVVVSGGVVVTTFISCKTGDFFWRRMRPTMRLAAMVLWRKDALRAQEKHERKRLRGEL